MRDIKFRAKDKNGEWVYGFYASGKYDCGSAVHYIVNDLTHIMSSCWGVDAIEIDHRTLGQSTGIKDRNGVEVYDGDIVASYYGAPITTVIAPVVFREGCFWVKTPNHSPKECILAEFIGVMHGTEVVGNIYENKDLLENKYD